MSEQEPRVAVRRADQARRPGLGGAAHGEMYARELGWDKEFEALVARIVATMPPPRSGAGDCWIAEVEGERVG